MLDISRRTVLNIYRITVRAGCYLLPITWLGCRICWCINQQPLTKLHVYTNIKLYIHGTSLCHESHKWLCWEMNAVRFPLNYTGPYHSGCQERARSLKPEIDRQLLSFNCQRPQKEKTVVL